MISIPSKGDELLETRLNEATNPLNQCFNIAATQLFCEQILNEPEGSQIAVRLLTHKVQSPQEKESLYSFDVIDECIKKCGQRFHQEVGKFRFINELIKVISPKYLAGNMSAKVKKRCVECLYGLYKGIPHESKLTEAYNLLKSERIIIDDPTYMDDKIYIVSDPSIDRTKSIFELSKDSERLSKLLKSRKPEDMKEANRIIKTVVLADNNRIEQLSRKQSQLETMKDNTESLKKMLWQCKSKEINSDELSLKEMADNLEVARSDMFQFSRESSSDEMLNEIIMAIANCNIVIKEYWDHVNGVVDEQSSDSHKSESCLSLFREDLLGDVPEYNHLSTDLNSITIPDTVSASTHSYAPLPLEASVSTTKYDELNNMFNCQNSNVALNSGSKTKSKSLQFISDGAKENAQPNRTPLNDYKGFEELEILGQEIFNLKLRQSVSDYPSSNGGDIDLLHNVDDHEMNGTQSTDESLPCSDLGIDDLVKNIDHRCLDDVTVTNNGPDTVLGTEDVVTSATLIVEQPNIDLSTIDLNLTDIEPHPLKAPVIIYDNEDTKVKVTLYFAKDRPHPSIKAMVAQIASMNCEPVSDVVLKFAVSKPQRIRVISNSIGILPSHSPFTPSTPINNIVLLYHATKNVVDMKYNLSYELNGEPYLESATTGVIDI